MNPVHTSQLTSLPLLARGKVRDNYAVGSDRILMVASDRISAFDVIMGEPITGKGALLTQMALFWFDKLTGIVPNHLTGDDPESVVTAAERAQVTGRSMLVKRLKPLPVEAVVRGYLAGSGWVEYQQSQSVCGVPLPAGLKNASKLPAPIFTPATKAEMGEHDENISFERMADIIGRTQTDPGLTSLDGAELLQPAGTWAPPATELQNFFVFSTTPANSPFQFDITPPKPAYFWSTRNGIRGIDIAK